MENIANTKARAEKNILMGFISFKLDNSIKESKN